jgi:hypothetical protein
VGILSGGAIWEGFREGEMSLVGGVWYCLGLGDVGFGGGVSREVWSSARPRERFQEDIFGVGVGFLIYFGDLTDLPYNFS